MPAHLATFGSRNISQLKCVHRRATKNTSRWFNHVETNDLGYRHPMFFAIIWLVVDLPL